VGTNIIVFERSKKKNISCPIADFVSFRIRRYNLVKLLQYKVDEFDRINFKAARIVTAATKLLSHELLYQETGWLYLAKRRRFHKLIVFHKMFHKTTVSYLSDLKPRSLQSINRPVTRSRNNIPSILCKTNQ